METFLNQKTEDKSQLTSEEDKKQPFQIHQFQLSRVLNELRSIVGRKAQKTNVGFSFSIDFFPLLIHSVGKAPADSLFRKEKKINLFRKCFYIWVFKLHIKNNNNLNLLTFCRSIYESQVSLSCDRNVPPILVGSIAFPNWK